MFPWRLLWVTGLPLALLLVPAQTKGELQFQAFFHFSRFRQIAVGDSDEDDSLGDTSASAEYALKIIKEEEAAMEEEAKQQQQRGRAALDSTKMKSRILHNRHKIPINN